MKCIGMTTGNSLDTIDAVLTNFTSDTMKTLCCHSVAIPPVLTEWFQGLKNRLKETGGDIRGLYQADSQTFQHHHDQYIRLAAQTVTELLAMADIAKDQIDAVGFHGQSCFHLPPSLAGNDAEPSTIQIGSGQMLADIIGIPVVFDFHSADIMNGGEASPLTPLHNLHLASQLRRQNIFPVAFCYGGRNGNISLITEDLNTKEPMVLGWDTGPFNFFPDYLCRTEKGIPYDRDGQFAKDGVVDELLLEELFDNAVPSPNGKNFLKLMPPKSSHSMWYKIIPALTDKSIPFANRLRTAEFFGTYCLVYNLNHIPYNLRRPEHFLLFGDGWKNPLICQDFENILRRRVHPLSQHHNLFKAVSQPEAIIEKAEDRGFSAKYMNADIFADMARCFLSKQPYTLPSTTGCLKPTICGKLVRPGDGNTQLWSEAAKGWKEHLKESA